MGYHRSVGPAIKRKKTTIEIPQELLDEAVRVSGRSITETVQMGLRLVAARTVYDKLLSLQGSYHSKLDLNALREDR